MHPPLRDFFFVAATTGSALLCACSSGGSVPNQVFTKPAPVTAPAPVPRTSGPWIYRPSTQPQAFVVDQKAVDRNSIGHSDAHRHRFIARGTFVLAHAAQSASESGAVAAFVVQSSGHAAATPAGLVTPFPFRGAYSARSAQLDFTAPRDAPPCASNALAVVQSMRDLWFRAPDTLRVGTVWEDSASYVACRDGIPMRATAHRSFRITGFEEKDGHPVLALVRSSRSTVDGTGTQFGETVVISGTGTGQLVYSLDAATGEILSASGNATLDLSLRSGPRTQTVRQTAEIRIGEISAA